MSIDAPIPQPKHQQSKQRDTRARTNMDVDLKGALVFGTSNPHIVALPNTTFTRKPWAPPHLC